MRISTLQVIGRGTNDMVDLTGQVTKTQEQISAGKSFLTPADDPVAATRILQLNQELALSEQYRANMGNAETRLKQEETQIASITEALDRVRELTMQAGDGALNSKDRTVIANEIKVRLGELRDLLNSRDAYGQYLFSGYQGDTQPFVDNGAGNFTYQGDEGQRILQIGSTTTVPIGDSGKALFVDIAAAKNTFVTTANPNNTASPAAVVNAGLVVDQTAFDAFYPDGAIIEFNPLGNVVPPGPNYTVRSKTDGRPILANQPFQTGQSINFNGISLVISGTPSSGDSFIVESTKTQDLLTTVSRIADALVAVQDGNLGGPKLKDVMDTALQNLDNTQTRLIEARAKVGARLNVIESSRSLAEEVDESNKEILSKLQDLDYAEAVSRLSFQSFVLEAAQQSFVKISGLSLFNFLR